jgi:hypothetical protein
MEVGVKEVAVAGLVGRVETRGHQGSREDWEVRVA